MFCFQHQSLRNSDVYDHLCYHATSCSPSLHNSNITYCNPCEDSQAMMTMYAKNLSVLCAFKVGCYKSFIFSAAK